MFTNNPFAGLAGMELTGSITPAVMQGYIILMVILVALGTILDMWHKKSAKYFFEKSKKWEREAKRQVSGGEKFGLLIKTILSEVLTSSEFCYTPRRISHLLTMYGFIIFVVTTAMIIFGADTSSGTLPFLWHLGALMLAIGGYWFWFFIRVDVSAEGHKWYAAVLRPVHHCRHHPVRHRPVVQVRPHVLQAGCGLREAHPQGGRHPRQPARRLRSA